MFRVIGTGTVTWLVTLVLWLLWLPGRDVTELVDLPRQAVEALHPCGAGIAIVGATLGIIVGYLQWSAGVRPQVSMCTAVIFGGAILLLFGWLLGEQAIQYGGLLGVTAGHVTKAVGELHRRFAQCRRVFVRSHLCSRLVAAGKVLNRAGYSVGRATLTFLVGLWHSRALRAIRRWLGWDE